MGARSGRGVPSVTCGGGYLRGRAASIAVALCKFLPMNRGLPGRAVTEGRAVGAG